ncbi:hypothetical protein OAQ55_00060 [bacterium]|nr:hypothetical protein [bacterium]
MTIQQHASFDSSAAELNATSKLVKAWESKNAKNAAKAGGVSLMALSLAACGGSSTTTTTSTDTSTDTTTTVAGQSLRLTDEADFVEGGAGDDTITALVDTMSAADEVIGGAGDDTMNIRMDANDVMGVVSGVETINITARGDNGAAPVDFTDVSGVTSVTLTGNTAFDLEEYDFGVALTFSDADDVYTVSYADLSEDDDAQALTVDGYEGTFTVGTTGLETLSVTGSGTASEFTVTDHATATIETVNIDGAADVNLTLHSSTDAVETVDASDATGSVTITASHTADMTITGGSGDDAIELGSTLTANDDIDGGAGDDELEGTIASASTLRLDAVNTEVLDINFTAAGTLDLRLTDSVTTMDMSGSSAAMDVNRADASLTSIVFTADSNQDFDVDYDTDEVGTLTVTIGDADGGDGEGVDTGDFTTDATTLTLAAIGDDANTIDTVTANTATSVSISTSTADGTFGVGNVTADAATSITLSAVAGDLTVGTYVDADTLASLSMSATGAADLTLGDVGDSGSNGVGSAFALTDITVTMGTGDLSLGTFDITTDDTDGVALDTISITSAGGSIQWADGGVAVDGAGEDEAANLSRISVTATADDLDLDFGDIEAAEIDEIVITTSGEDGDATFDAFIGTDVGNVTLSTGEDLDLTITEIASDSIADISLTAARDATLTLDDLDIDGDIGDIELIGAGSFDIDITDADTVGDIDAATGVTDDTVVNIDASGAEAAVTVTFGVGSNTYTAAASQDDEITLASDAGTDTIITGTTAGSIIVYNFEAGASGDKVTVDVSGVDAGLLAAAADELVHIIDTGDEIAAADAVVFHTATSTASTRDLDNATANSNILVLDTDFAAAANVIDGTAGIATSGAFAITLGDNIAEGDGFLVLWDDGADSYLSLIENSATGGDSDGGTMAAADLSITNLIMFDGVDDVTDLTAAANFNAFV